MTKKVRPSLDCIQRAHGVASCVMMAGCSCYLDLNIYLSLVGSTIDSNWPAPLEIICFFFLPSYTPLSLIWSYQSCSEPLADWYSHTTLSYEFIPITVPGGTHYVSSSSVSLLRFHSLCADPLVVLLLRFTAVGGCSHLPTCFPFLVWIAMTIHSVQSSIIPSVDICNKFSFIIFVRHLSLPSLRVTHRQKIVATHFWCPAWFEEKEDVHF